MANYQLKESSSRIIKAHNVNWTGTGTAFTTNFLSETWQIRVLSSVAGYISIVPTTADATVPTTAGVGTMISANVDGEYFTVTPGMILGYASTTTSTVAGPILSVTEMA